MNRESALKEIDNMYTIIYGVISSEKNSKLTLIELEMQYKELQEYLEENLK